MCSDGAASTGVRGDALGVGQGAVPRLLAGRGSPRARGARGGLVQSSPSHTGRWEQPHPLTRGWGCILNPQGTLNPAVCFPTHPLSHPGAAPGSPSGRYEP